MTSPTDDQIVRSIRLYRETLQQTRAVYIESGTLVRGSYGWLTGGDDTDASAIAGQMDDLHQGLVMKVFADVVGRTQADSMHERQMGRVLLEHLWGKSVMGEGLHEAVRWLIDTAATLQYSDVLRPFAEIPSIRDRAGTVQSLAIRQAKLIAAVDGQTDAGDVAVIESLSRTMAAMQDDVPQQRESQTDTDMARDAIAWLRTEAKRLRGDATSASNIPEAEIATPIAGPGGTPKPPAKVAVPPPDDRTPEQRLAEARGKLDQLVGLDAIKDQIETLTNFLAMQRKRVEAELPVTKPSLHMSFVGNPGTGKTTVARIIADIYGALGVLEKGHLVETDRSGLVAEYAGQTGPKTNAKIDEALDGVLFIDEAYTLIDESGQDQYGREAIQTLLKRMEDQRDRLIVIVAGYPVEMNKMIRSNPGLSSRIGTTMTFEDYEPMALCQIFELIASKAKYELPTDSRRRLLRGFTYLYINRDRHFGNGRTSRNSFERSVRRMANRLAAATEITRELLVTLQPQDIEVDGVTMAHLDAMADEPGRVRIQCEHCDAATVVSDTLLGTDVSCESCGKTELLKWGTPVATLPEPEQPTSR